MNRKKKNNYFGDEQEEAVLKYKSAESQEEKDRIYSEYLHKPFQEMVSGIVKMIQKKHSLHLGNYEVEEVESYALSHLIEQFVLFDQWKPEHLYRRITPIYNMFDPEYLDDIFKVNFYLKVKTDENGFILIADPIIDEDSAEHEMFLDRVSLELIGQETTLKNFDSKFTIRIEMLKKKHVVRIKDFDTQVTVSAPVHKPRKAYSYCGTIVRNFLINFSSDNYKELVSKVHYDTVRNPEDPVLNKEIYEMNTDLEDKDFIDIIMETTVESIQEELDTNEFLTEETRKVGDALVNILTYWDVLFEENKKKTGKKFDKKRFMFLVKEQTNLQSADVGKAMKRFIEIYYSNKREIVKKG